MHIEVIFTDHRAAKFGLPAAQTFGSAGLDLRVFWPDGTHRDDMKILPGEQVMLDTGMRVWIGNPGYAGFLFPRSSSGVKGLVLGNGTGVIDSDYQGPLKVCLLNRSNKTIEVADGDRVAQLVIMPVASGYEIKAVEEFHDETVRGSGGFGSTGVR